MLNWFKRLFMKAAPARPMPERVVVRARYDAAQTTAANRNHWANTDALSARLANSLDVRKKLRERARYERSNNPYLEGIVLTLANTLVGSGPRLRLNTRDKAFNAAVEAAWIPWAKAARLPDQLRIMKAAKTIDGEAFGVFKSNPRLTHPVNLDLQLLECDHFSSPFLSGVVDEHEVDGIRFDQWGNPASYSVLRHHPGDLLGTMGANDRLSAGQVLHWFRQDRPGQVRGIPEVTSALPLFAMLRRFGMATLTAAEVAASFAALLESNFEGQTDDEEADAWATMQIVHGMMTALPNKVTAKQLAAEHPTTNHEMFVKVVLREIARCLCMPWILASLDSSASNFSSARLDILIFRSAIAVERQDCEREVLTPTFFAWLAEAKLLPNVLLPYRATIEALGYALPVEWVWPAWEYINPKDEAEADSERLRNGTATLGEICAERGKDWREHKRQQVAEREYDAEIGLSGTDAADLQSTALNGAQIDSLLKIVEGVTAGQLPTRAAQAMMMAAFPNVAPSLLDRITDSLNGFTPRPVDAVTPSTLQPAQAVAAGAIVPIKASAPPPRVLVQAGAGSITIEAAAGEGLRRFSMLAYTGGALPLAEYPHPVVVDLTGLTVPDQRRPVFRDHRPWKVIGHTERIVCDLGKWTVSAEGVISGVGPDAKEVLTVAGNGFPWQCSIGAGGQGANLQFVQPGQQAEANGRTFDGPVYILRRSTLNEISFVPIGADSAATASIAATQGGFPMTFEQWLLGLGYSLEEIGALTEEAKTALQRAYEAANPSSEPASDPATAMATGATPTPVAAAARVPMVQATVTANGQGHVDVAAQMRQDAAAELNRQAAIRRVPGLTPELEGEVEISAGQRQRVSIMAHAISSGWTPERTELEVHRNTRVSNVHGYVTSSRPQANDLILEAALCRSRMLPNIEQRFTPQVLEALDRSEYRRGVGLQQVILMAAAQGGYPVGYGQRINAANIRSVLQHVFGHHVRVQAGWTPISVPGILSNVANKEITAGYEQEDGAWREVAQIKSVSDFKEVTSYKLLDSMEYEALGPGGEIKHGRLDEESYTRSVKTYAKMLSITREQIINDDMDAFGTIRNRLGRGSAMKIRNLFWTTWLANASTIWTSGRTNYISGSTTNLGTDGVGLGLGVKALREMRSPSADGSKRVGVAPSILLVPPELESTADAYYNNRNYGAGTTVANSNTHAGKYRPVVAAELSDSAFTGYSTTAWWLLIDPAIAAAVVVSFLDGQQMPTIEDAEADFNVLGIQFRGFHDFGCNAAEYLVGVMSKGAA